MPQMSRIPRQKPLQNWAGRGQNRPPAAPNEVTRIGASLLVLPAMKKQAVKPKAPTHFEQIPVEIVKKIALEKPSAKKPTGPTNVVAEPMAQKTEPYSMPLSSLCWTGR
jgi:hypothetical protein